MQIFKTIISALTMLSNTILIAEANLTNYSGTSELDYLITPEIKNDAFYNSIYFLARTRSIKTALEIGSSSGEGSTEAFVSGLRENPNYPTLYCMEVSQTRFVSLKKHYEKEKFVTCYNVSSIPITDFASEKEVCLFYQKTLTALNNFPLKKVIGWLKQDIDYIKAHNIPQNGIELIKTENGIKYFDMVLIDGSEFTGKRELDLIYGAKFILLDDINTFKNHFNYQRLLADPSYTLLEVNKDLRNGYAIFELNQKIIYN